MSKEKKDTCYLCGEPSYSHTCRKCWALPKKELMEKRREAMKEEARSAKNFITR
jgi:hypothetical protein